MTESKRLLNLLSYQHGFKTLLGLVENDNYRNALLWHDYFLLLLFTGMRKMEAASLKWDDVDLISRTITIQDTKNHEVHTLAMSDFVYELMELRSHQKKPVIIYSQLRAKQDISMNLKKQ